jgi:3-oxoacyl-[acyl-carrier-protein] synthase II
VSPFGIGRDAFAAGLREGRATAALDGEAPDGLPQVPTCAVPGFGPRETLGRKGTRSMDRVTGLAVAAVGALLDDDERNRSVGTGADAAFTLGTTTGSAQSMMDFTRDSLTGERPFFVDPARFPNTVMNCAAGQSAIWHRLRGPNATLAGGRTAGLHALNYARRLLGSGRAKTVLCGAAEELTAARAWLEHHAGSGSHQPAPLGEGCAMLLVEPESGDNRETSETSENREPSAGQPVLAEVSAVELGVVLHDDVRTALANCLRRALRQAGAEPGDVAVMAPSSPPDEASDGAGAAEIAAVREVLGEHPHRIGVPELIGDTGAAAAGMQAAALLAYAAEQPRRTAGRLGLITSVDRGGSVGCALLTLR